MDEGMTADDRFIHRSAKTGQFVSDEEADAQPDTTVTEKVPNYSRFRRIANILLDHYEKGFRAEDLGNLTVWLVNGPTCED